VIEYVQKGETTMFEIATFTPNRTVQLPPEIASRFLPTDSFIVWLEGDTLHLKRLIPSPLQRIEDAPAGEPLPLVTTNPSLALP